MVEHELYIVTAAEKQFGYDTPVRMRTGLADFDTWARTAVDSDDRIYQLTETADQW